MFPLAVTAEFSILIPLLPEPMTTLSVSSLTVLSAIYIPASPVVFTVFFLIVPLHPAARRIAARPALVIVFSAIIIWELFIYNAFSRFLFTSSYDIAFLSKDNVPSQFSKIIRSLPWIVLSWKFNPEDDASTMSNVTVIPFFPCWIVLEYTSTASQLFTIRNACTLFPLLSYTLTFCIPAKTTQYPFRLENVLPRISIPLHPSGQMWWLPTPESTFLNVHPETVMFLHGVPSKGRASAAFSASGNSIWMASDI